MWWIENPETGYLGKRPFMRKLPYVDIGYCHLSDWGYKNQPDFGAVIRLRVCPVYCVSLLLVKTVTLVPMGRVYIRKGWLEIL